MPAKIAQEEQQQQLKQLEYDIQYHETIENSNHHQLSINESKIPKKRGPKKKQMTPSRIARFKVRRIKANGRERERMKGLNEQLELLRNTIPCFSLSQKLSKIETLRLAKNYIEALTQMISTNQILDNTQFVQLLSKGLSSNTMNLLAATLSLNPRLLEQNDENYIHPQVKNPLEFINLKKSTNLTSESEDDTRIYNHDYGSSYNGDSSIDDITPMNIYSNEYLPDHSFYYCHPTYY